MRIRGTVSRAVPSRSRDPVYPRSARPVEVAPEGLRLGQPVAHPKFGEGVVLNYEGDGTHARVQVNFKDAGSKWLVLAYANLQPV